MAMLLLAVTTAVRLSEHKITTQQPRNRNCPALHGAIRKYGESIFKIETLYEAVNWQEACKVERGLIAQYGTLAPNGYNLTCGGEGTLGAKFSDAERARRSAAAKGRVMSQEQRDKISAANKGLSRSDEQKLAMSARMKEKMKSPEARAFISQVNIGRVLTTEHRLSISLAQLGRSHTAETRAKMSAWQIGRKFSDETKQRISKARKRGFVVRRIVAQLQAKAEAKWKSGQTNSPS